ALMVADAFALAFFTMLGTQKGVVLHFSPPVAVLLGVVTGVAGGIARDVLTGEVPMVFRPEIHLYATASLCGAVLYVVLPGVGAGDSLATLAGAGLVLALRLAAIYWKLSLPLFEAR
ncbi:MAG: TRIC cation channel family protein, partial [Verrucomicrobiia bacterium]